MTNAKRDRRLVPVPSNIRARVSEMLRDHGASEGARRLGVSKEAAIRVIAGLDVMRGTLAILREHLAGEGVAA